MKNLTYQFLAIALLVSACSQPETSSMTDNSNPFYQVYDTPFGIPPFKKINNAHYQPAFVDGMSQQINEVDAIATNPEAPTFENTIAAFEKSGELLTKVSKVFFNLASADTNDSIQSISKEISPLLSAHNDDIFLNEQFFERVQTLQDQKEELKLTIEQAKLLGDYYEQFVRSGAALSQEDKAKMRVLNERLSLLALEFGENVLGENNKFEMLLLSEKDLSGLPASVKTAAAEAAAEKGYDGQYLFTTHKPSLLPFITYADSREHRMTLKKGYINRGDNNDDLDNKAILIEMVNLRLEKANLLGYESHADYVLQQRMLKSPAEVYGLLDKVWPAAIARAKEERDLMKAMALSEGQDIEIGPWDWWYYAEKIKMDSYNLDEGEIRPYLKVDNVINGTFILANKLFGMTFEERNDLPKYHPDVRTYTVKNEQGVLIGIYLSDWYYRTSKRGGAWMNTYRDQSNMDGQAIVPIAVNVGNFTKPSGDSPSLLSMDEATTLFHEFGHALHGLLSECTYPSISGTATPRDFVEFPSQVLENWVYEPEMLDLYAFHYETGEVMPAALVDKIRKAGTFNQGFATV
ncbi:MAG: peptidyl-dipeptidase Dcp, partial [Paraglaciecola sp.]